MPRQKTTIEPAEPQPRLLLVTQVRVHGQAIGDALARYAGFETAASLPEDVAVAVRIQPPDVVLVDFAEVGAVEQMAMLFAAIGDVPVLAFGVPAIEASVIACAQAGVRGIVIENGSLDDIAAAVRQAVSGELSLAPAVGQILLQRVRETPVSPASPETLLTRRENEILELIERGHSNKEIANDLHLGLSTVKNHVRSILAKLGVRRRTEAAARLRQARHEVAGPGPRY
jgi:DNA-binding NarL/FixJ family response regulator